MSKEIEKTVHTVLDDLPYGDGIPEYENAEIRGVRLPDGVKGSALMRDVLMIAWPSMLELILTQLTSMVDQMMVGHLPGQEGITALSAVGLAAQPRFLLLVMMIALNTGGTAVIARYRGQQNQAKANQTYRQSMVLNFLLSGFFSIVGIILAEPLVRFMGAGGITQETIEQATVYLRIQMYGFIPLCMTTTTTAALRGVGDTRTPLIYNTVANVVNVIGNYLLIYGKFGFPKMGVAGASLATVIGQCAACGMALYVSLSGKRYIKINLKEKFRFDRVILSNVVGIGAPAMVDQLCMRVGSILFVRTVAGLGDMLYATHNVLMNIMGMTLMLGQAFATSSTTLMGQSLGKRRADMAALYMRYVRRLGIYISVVMGCTLAILRAQVISLYNSTPEVVAVGSQIMFIMAILQPFQTDQFIVAGGLRGAGDTKYTAMVTAVTVLLTRNIVSWFAVNILEMGLWGAWIAIISDQIVRTGLVNARYLSGKWRHIRLAEKR